VAHSPDLRCCVRLIFALEAFALAETWQGADPGGAFMAKEKRMLRDGKKANEKRNRGKFFLAVGTIRATIDQNSLANEPFVR
jgi:hypothetical protein